MIFLIVNRRKQVKYGPKKSDKLLFTALNIF
jgi:hypothetical protein